jgi:hypothetical protein
MLRRMQPDVGQASTFRLDTKVIWTRVYRLVGWFLFSVESRGHPRVVVSTHYFGR